MIDVMMVTMIRNMDTSGTVNGGSTVCSAATRYDERFLW